MTKVIDNFAQFESKVAGFAEELDEQANDYKAMIALNIVAGVIDLSPIDTGLYKGNWLAEIGHPNMREMKTPDKDGSRTLSRATAAIEKARPLDDIWVTNNKVYAPHLEFGTPHMAPRRILGRVLALVEQIGKRPSGPRVRARAAKRRRAREIHSEAGL